MRTLQTCEIKSLGAVRLPTAAMSTSYSELVQACVFYMICSAGMSVFNKLAVRALPLPITLVCVQMAFTLASLACQRKSVHIGSMRDALRWGLTVPFIFAAMLVRARLFFRAAPSREGCSAGARETAHPSLRRCRR